MAFEESGQLRELALGSRRWYCAWWTEVERPEGEEFDPVNDLEDHGRAFPSPGLAVAFARKLTDYYGAPLVRGEVFALWLEQAGYRRLGHWVSCNEWEEVVPVEVQP